MAMILEAFVGRYVNQLSEFLEGEMSMMLGVKDEIKKVQRSMERIRGFLESAEWKRYADPNINNWVVELKDVMYDADDIIDRCMIQGRILLENHPSTLAVRDTSSSFYSPGFLKFKHEIGKKIKELNDRLKEINKDRSKLPALKYTRQSAREGRVNTRQTFPNVIKSDIVGPKIEEATQSLVELLIKDDNKKYRVLGIVGMGGIGKTTLASNIYNNKIIKENFPIRVWVCISQDFSETKMLKEIIRGAGGKYGKAETKAELVTCLSFVLSKRFFIVLDDVWEKDVWEDLLRYAVENATSTGKIVITTRDRNVAGSIVAEREGIHRVDKMDDHSGWKLLCKIVFGDDDEEEEISSLKEIGVRIVEKCDGLPLAIKVIAGVLRSKERSNLEWNKVLKSGVWSMSQLQEKLPRALFLSYEYLPSDCKQCFLYFSLFPEDYKMDRNELIHYWVAEGFVRGTQGDTIMEDLAEDFCRELIGRNLLQPCDYFGRLSDVADNYCKMHDLLRSLAHSLIRDESIFLGDHEQSPNTNPLSKLRRLSMVNKGERLEAPDVLKQQKCLRTLFVWNSYETKMVENELFKKLRFLRVMDLSGTRLESLPDSVGDLLHLRYLNVSKTEIKELPESIGCLVNLEVLNLSGCGYLHTLPKAITKLCNLRCLCLQGIPLTHVPKGIGKLKHLNHLQGFVIGHDEGCDLKELQSLSQLRFLEIRSLERAQPSGALVLVNSRCLRTLFLNGEEPSIYSEETIQRNDKIYNELSPQSTHLQELWICDFFGTGFPSWMMSPSLGVSFPNLTTIVLFHCKSCPQLPPLGLLPHLKSLEISRADSIKTIGPEFLGPRASSGATSFPNLEMLYLFNMSNWEEWSFGMVEGVGEERRGAPKLLPRLNKLELNICPKLRALPPLGQLPQLKSLCIMEARAINTIGPEFLGPPASSGATSFPKLEQLQFKWMYNWEEWSFGMVEGVGEERRGAPKLLPRLTNLELYECPKLRALPPLGQLPQLKSLCISEARAINTIGPEFLGPRESSAATSFPNLEELRFEQMSNWEEWSFGMVEGVGEERRGAPKLLPRLTKFELSFCSVLRALPPLGLLPELKSLYIHKAEAIKTIGPEFLGPRASSEATSFPMLEKLEFWWMSNWEEWSFGMVEGFGEERRGAPKLLPCLTKLGLFNCPKLRALPEGLRHATNLQELKIYGADNLKEINNLPSLKSLEINDCPRLEHVENLDKLQDLYVRLETSTTDADGQTERLPQWLLELLQNAPIAMHSLQKFNLRCSLPLLKTFLKDGPNWPIIQPIPLVIIQKNVWSRSYIRYTKDPLTFEANVEE
ncbi:putative disease resistance protein RGA3 [Elaeis guineensis]|uniref:putative disease resistance protein RGA3 n=1 Tax=Elaeis guineensis var. tenera TaxID=51953 RepID=UPI003C6DA752